MSHPHSLCSTALRRPGSWARVALATVVALLALARPATAQLPAPPVVGTGPFQIGGYGTVTVSRPEHPEEVEGSEVSDLVAAAMFWGRITRRTSYFAELDMAKRSSETWTGREASETLAPVRLYLEYAASDALRFRAGRFLTPLGEWNERYAEPLTWTPTRPLTTYRPFAKSLTGLLLAGEGSAGSHDVGYALFWAPTWDLDWNPEEAEESSFANAFGGRVAAELGGGFTVGVSASRMRRSHPRDEQGEDQRDEDEGQHTLLGADARWAGHRVELAAEGAWLARYDGEPGEGGAFLLTAVRLAGPVWGVARGEAYHPVDGRSARTAFAGLTVRAGPHFVLKAGKQFSRKPSAKIPDGWFLSFSSLF